MINLIVLAFICLCLIGGLLNIYFDYFDFFYHDILRWHNGKGGKIGFDGCSFTSTCSKCGKKVLQDSQGNWFSIE